MNVYVHNGSFHLDEILAIALLMVFGGYCIEDIIRTRDVDILSKAKEDGQLVIDVGGEFNGVNLFDHHHDRSLRSSAGLIFDFLELKGKVTGLDELVILADEHDLGIKRAGKFELPMIINNYNGSPESSDKDFKDALAVVVKVLKSMKFKQETLDKASVIIDASEFIFPGVLMLPEYVGVWTNFINAQLRPDVKAICWYDKHQDTYKIQVSPVEVDSFEMYGPKLPKSELMEFVHNTGFLAVAKDLQILKEYICSCYSQELLSDFLKV